jgi:hypothetical protein
MDGSIPKFRYRSRPLAAIKGRVLFQRLGLIAAYCTNPSIEAFLNRLEAKSRHFQIKI